MTLTTDHALKSIEKAVPATVSLVDKVNSDSTLTREESPNFKGWYLANTLDSICRANTDPFMPIFARSIGASASQIGFLSGIYTLINISQLFWARLSTKMKKNRLFIV
ncbi:MAG: hypothetical protein ACFFCQ_10365, partial [Promethearchaeota archaeon]